MSTTRAFRFDYDGALNTTGAWALALVWFAPLQRRYVNSEHKSQMLLEVASLAVAGKAYCRALAELFTLAEPPAGHTLYVKGEKPDRRGLFRR